MSQSNIAILKKLTNRPTDGQAFSEIAKDFAANTSLTWSELMTIVNSARLEVAKEKREKDFDAIGT